MLAVSTQIWDKKEKQPSQMVPSKIYFLLSMLLCCIAMILIAIHQIHTAYDHHYSDNDSGNNNNAFINMQSHKHREWNEATPIESDGGGGIHNNNNNSTFAFASFLSFQGFEGCYTASNFIDSVAKLGVSWRRMRKRSLLQQYNNNNVDMLLLIVDAPCRHFYSMQRLQDIGWKIVWVETPIWYTPKTNERKWSWIAGNRYEHTSQFSKLFLWNFTQYKHILYMDSDILLIHDPMQYILPRLPYAHSQSLGMDHCNITTTCNQATQRVCDTSDCNAGAMLITPSAYEFRRMLLHIPSVSFDREFQEQSFLQHYWTPQYNRTVFGFPRNFIAIPYEYKSFSFGAVHFLSSWKPWGSLLAQNFKSLSELWNGYCGYADCI